MSPIDLGNMDQSLQSVEGDEKSVGKDSADDSFDRISDLELLESQRSLFFDSGFLREYDFLAFLVDIDDADLEGLSDQSVQVGEDLFRIGTFDSRIIDGSQLGNRDETLDSIEIDQESTFVRLIRDYGDDFFGIKIRMEP